VGGWCVVCVGGGCVFVCVCVCVGGWCVVCVCVHAEFRTLIKLNNFK